MHATRLAPILSTLALVAPLAAMAASGDKPAFEDADANGDGSVAVKEATDAGIPQKEAEREDIDNDGKLSQTDWKFIDMNPAQQTGQQGGQQGGSSGSSS